MEEWFLSKAEFIQANPCMCEEFKRKFVAFLLKSVAPLEEEHAPSVSSMQAFTLHR
jgi:hypothetical protein